MRWVASASGSFVPGLTNSAASIAPRPRTSPMRPVSFASARSRGNTVFSMRRAESVRFSFRIVSIEPSAAAHAIGLPP